MSRTRSQLQKLMKLGVVSLMALTLLSVGVLYILQLKITWLTSHATPSQLRLIKVKSDLDALLSFAYMLDDVESHAKILEIESKTSSLFSSFKRNSRSGDSPESLEPLVRRAISAFDTLSGLAKLRVADQLKTARAVSELNASLAVITSGIEKLAGIAETVATESQTTLDKSRIENQRANQLIQNASNLRDKLTQLKLLVFEVSTLDKKFKINPHREKFVSLFDNISSLDIKGLDLSPQVDALKAQCDAKIMGESGLIARRGELLKSKTSPSDDDLFRDLQKDAAKAADAAISALLAKLDPLELAVTQEGKRMTTAVQQMGRAQQLSARASKALVTVQQLKTEAEVAVRSLDRNSVQTQRATLRRLLDSVERQLKEMAFSLREFAWSTEMQRASTQGVTGALAYVESARKKMFSETGTFVILENICRNREVFGRKLKDCSENVSEAMSTVASHLGEAEDVLAKTETQVSGLVRITPLLLLLISLGVAYIGRRNGMRIIEEVLGTETKQTTLMQDQQDMVAGLSQGTRTLASEATLLLELSHTLAKHADSTKSRAESSLKKITSVTHSNHETVRRIETLAMDATSIFEEMSRASASMKSAVGICESTRKQAEELKSTSHRIGGITQTISGIAEQIHILSLNASIEAKRAGDAGRSFDVLAQQVRALAKRTANAAVDIQSIVSSTQEQVFVLGRDIASLVESVREVHHMQDNAASSADNQQKTTRDATHSVLMTAESGNEIAKNFEAVAEAATGASDAAMETQKASQRLEEFVKELTRLIQTEKAI